MRISKKWAVLAGFLLALVTSVSISFANTPSGLSEAEALLAAAARESGRPSYSESTAVSFKPSENQATMCI